MKIGNRVFDTDNNTFVMGILNITPDSFSDGGRFVVSNWEGADINQVLRACDEMLAYGADIIDVGGESTRPGAAPVSATEEMGRVIPVVEAITKRFDAVVSVDTYKAEVAGEAVRAGARLINDIWGLKGDELMPKAVAEIMGAYDGVALCIMHNRKPVNTDNAHGMQDNGRESGLPDIPITMYGEDTDYGYRKSGTAVPRADEDLFMEDVIEDLRQSIGLAKAAGVDTHKIILDPGVGFAKTYEQNLAVMRRMDELRRAGMTDPYITDHEFPILLGSSRKSVIGKALDAGVDKRLAGTLATTAFAYMTGVDFVRVHDVRENAEVIKMLKAIRG